MHGSSIEKKQKQLYIKQINLIYFHCKSFTHKPWIPSKQNMRNLLGENARRGRGRGMENYSCDRRRRAPWLCSSVAFPLTELRLLQSLQSSKGTFVKERNPKTLIHSLSGYGSFPNWEAHWISPKVRPFLFYLILKYQILSSFIYQ